jgi:REP element-mobilizing transposase RayT
MTPETQLDEPFRTALRLSIGQVRQILPFTAPAWVLLPDHLHCNWTLPEDDSDFSGRWLQIKESGVCFLIRVSWPSPGRNATNPLCGNAASGAPHQR